MSTSLAPAAKQSNTNWLDWLLSDDTLRKIQAGSGLAFSAFLSLHLLNTFSANGGEETYNAVQAVVRKFYQNKAVEIVVVTESLLVHMTVSAVRMVRRWNKQKLEQQQNQQQANTVIDGESRVSKTDTPVEQLTAGQWTFPNPLTLPPLTLHRWSGYFLLAVIPIHAFATRGLSLLTGVIPAFDYVAWSLHHVPIVFYPYYTLLGSSGIYHGLYGIRAALMALGWKKPVLNPHGAVFRSVVAVGSVAVVSSLLALGGMYFPINQERFPLFTHNVSAFTKHLGRA